MVYIVHQVLAVHLVRRVMRTMGWREIEHWPLFVLANLIVIALVAALGLALDRLPAPRAPRPLLLRMLLGR